jgi:hypothetical protein
MCRTHHNLYTLSQLERLFDGWQCTEAAPRMGQRVLVAFPSRQALEVDLIEVERSPHRGTYGDKLFKVTMSSRAGRAFDECVQEAHVRAFLWHRAEQRRIANLAAGAALSLACH